MNVCDAIGKITVAVGRRTHSNGVSLLGTAFLTPRKGCFATTKHVVGQDDNNLVIILTGIDNISNYQDTSVTKIKVIPATIIKIDPFHDICLLQTLDQRPAPIVFGGIDLLKVGECVGILGYPHADHGRLVLTFQTTLIGAKVLLEVGKLKSKHAVLNIQTRPGQSGSPVISLQDSTIIGMIVGSYAPNSNSSISFGGVVPHTLHQTTHAVSIEYLKEML